MLYQLPLNLSLLLILLDFGLIVSVIHSSKWERWRALSRIATLVIFCGFSVLKLIGTSPTFLASSPNELVFKSDDEIGKLYFARNGDNGLFIFWEEKINGKEGRLTFEMEGIYPNSLLIFKEINQKLLEFRPDLELDGDTWKPIPVEINYSEFQPISQEGELAFKSHRKVAWANYASQAVSLMFLASFLSTSFKRRSKTS
ncbi:hypothetical protein DFQ04_1977 [Algoriphagus boseongensis]|uniref:Uncharacterized protein n=1 Tax=Algoriphagus boseongensis TaxID=1442587 RepID=A0A4R6T7V1_9BACT|nr:hypothetical protein [Algoriphagus boseongensis]TDQ17325.1 hypothetical protein DFQ04_1977 [Algoriphagus boseongensis]